MKDATFGDELPERFWEVPFAGVLGTRWSLPATVRVGDGKRCGVVVEVKREEDDADVNMAEVASEGQRGHDVQEEDEMMGGVTLGREHELMTPSNVKTLEVLGSGTGSGGKRRRKVN